MTKEEIIKELVIGGPSKLKMLPSKDVLNAIKKN